MKKHQTSKLLLIWDYAIALFLILMMIMGQILNYIAFTTCIDPTTFTAPIDIGTIGIILTAWIAQLGISSAAYYFMAKSDHAIELPAKIIKELPKEMQKEVDPTQVIVAAIQTKN